MSYRARRKLKDFYRRDAECAEKTERRRVLRNGADQDHWACGLRHAACRFERYGECFCRDARGKLLHHVTHLAVLGIEDTGADRRATHRHEPQLVALIGGRRDRKSDGSGKSVWI